MSNETEIGNLCREIGWSTRELARRWKCNERTARGWAEYQEDEHGARISGVTPPMMLLPWLRFIANTIRANPPPEDWRVRAVNHPDQESDQHAPD